MINPVCGLNEAINHVSSYKKFLTTADLKYSLASVGLLAAGTATMAKAGAIFHSIVTMTTPTQAGLLLLDGAALTGMYGVPAYCTAYVGLKLLQHCFTMIRQPFSSVIAYISEIFTICVMAGAAGACLGVSHSLMEKIAVVSQGAMIALAIFSITIFSAERDLRRTASHTIVKVETSSRMATYRERVSQFSWRTHLGSTMAFGFKGAGFIAMFKSITIFYSIIGTTRLIWIGTGVLRGGVLSYINAALILPNLKNYLISRLNSIRESEASVADRVRNLLLGIVVLGAYCYCLRLLLTPLAVRAMFYFVGVSVGMLTLGNSIKDLLIWAGQGSSNESRTKALELIISAALFGSEDLYLSNLGLTSLPQSIRELRRLRHLDVSNNNLTLLPRSIGNLTRLERLDVSNNKLIFLPREIGELAELNYFNISNNELNFLPPQIENIAGSLSILSVLKGNNPFMEFPPEGQRTSGAFRVRSPRSLQALAADQVLSKGIHDHGSYSPKKDFVGEVKQLNGKSTAFAQDGLSICSVCNKFFTRKPDEAPSTFGRMVQLIQGEDKQFPVGDKYCQSCLPPIEEENR